jgi:hypothetical protein
LPAFRGFYKPGMLAPSCNDMRIISIDWCEREFQ